MLGILYFVVFIILGLAAANRTFSQEPIYIRAWLGGITGITSMMWLVVPFAFLLGFSFASHLSALALMAVLYLIARRYGDREGSLNGRSDGPDYVLYVSVILFSIPVIYLLNGHVLATGSGGGLYAGQSTYGDLSLHLGIITSMAEQGVFPPEYSIFPGKRLSYPFLGDSLSASLYLFGTPLRWAVLVPSYVMTVLLISGFFILAYEMLRHKYAAAFATTVFFLNGGFGFVYFLDGLKINPSNFTRMFSSWYTTPTNYNEHFIRWSNIICDIIIPQRTTLVGWTLLFAALWLLHRAIGRNERRLFIYSGVLAGLMPMVHTHSFLGFGIIAATWFFVYLFQTVDFKAYLRNWIYCGVTLSVLALPQLVFWTFTQAKGEGFVRWQSGWQANQGDIWLWFWVKNVGLVFILLFPAILAARRKMLSIYSGAISLFVIASFVLFQPNAYDNNKLFYIWYAFTVILVSAYLFSVYRRMEGMRARWTIMAIILFFCTFSGLLTLGREINSNGKYLLFDAAAVEAADFVKEKTAKDAIFLSADQHLNPVAALAGRTILAGSSIYLFFHGIEKSGRDREIERMFKNPGEFRPLAAKYRVDYVYFSSFEREKYGVGPDFFKSTYPLVFQKGDIMIFAVSGRAIVKYK